MLWFTASEMKIEIYNELTVPSQELLWKDRWPYAFLVCRETPTNWGILSDLLLCISVNHSLYKDRMTKFLLTTQALVSIFSWSFLTTASTSWILASLNSSEDPYTFSGIWEMSSLQGHIIRNMQNMRDDSYPEK